MRLVKEQDLNFRLRKIPSEEAAEEPVPYDSDEEEDKWDTLGRREAQIARLGVAAWYRRSLNALFMVNKELSELVAAPLFQVRRRAIVPSPPTNDPLVARESPPRAR